VASNSAIIGFYSGVVPDDRGRYLREIQQWPDDRLEDVHDSIQWMFPLRERSAVNPTAPVLDAATIAEFQSRTELQENLRLSFIRMLKFYGLETESSPKLTVKPAANFHDRARVWLRPGNHNHLRITRIIKSLRLLGLEAEARAFFECLAGIFRSEKPAAGAISSTTFQYWKSAAEDD
jgi:hypothetical protein